MDRVKVLAHKHLPQRLPIVWTMVAVLWMEQFRFGSVARACTWSFVAFVWVVAVVGYVLQRPTTPIWND